MKKHNSEHKKDVLRLATFVGELMLQNGAETIRVEEAVKRICKSRGFYHINVFMAANTIIVSDDRFDGFTFMKVIKNRCINLHKIDLLNDFSRKFVADKEWCTKDAIKYLKRIDMSSPHSKLAKSIWTGIGSSSFAALVGGNDFTTFLLTLIISVVAIVICNTISEVTSIPAFGTMVASLVIGLFGVGFVKLGILSTPKMLIIGSIMPLLPGIAFIKATRDIVSGELASGVGRFMEANLTAISIATGVGIAMNIYMGTGGIL